MFDDVESQVHRTREQWREVLPSAPTRAEQAVQAVIAERLPREQALGTKVWHERRINPTKR